MQTDLGTIYKLNIHIEGLPNTMDDVDFEHKLDSIVRYGTSYRMGNGRR